MLNDGTLNNYELTLRAFDGMEMDVSYNAATFHNRERQLQGVFASARDVTERKRFEQALHAKNIELEHATRLKSEFLAAMSHELRTPLNAVIGFSEALKDGLIGPLTDVQQEYMGDILNSGQHLLSLINDILDLSKVEAGMMSLDLEAVDLNALLAGSLTIVRENASVRRVTLELEAEDGLGVTQLDPRKTKQIVYNLLSNAVKFSADQGATALLKSDPLAAAIPIVALTALAMKVDQERSLLAGCSAYIAKPLRYRELYSTIDSLLPEAEPPSTAKDGYL